MHETAVVAGLMRLLTERAAAAEIDRIDVVRLMLGRLRGLDARQIRGAFEIFAEGTPAEGARLDIEEVVPEARCRACDRVFALPDWNFACPECGGDDAEVVRGRELHLVSFDGRRTRPRGDGEER